MLGSAVRVLSRPYSGSLRQAENLTRNLAACHKPSIEPIRHKGYLSRARLAGSDPMFDIDPERITGKPETERTTSFDLSAYLYTPTPACYSWRVHKRLKINY